MTDDRFIIDNGALIGYSGGDETVVIPDGVTEIGEYAFAGCFTALEIVIPEGVTVIRENAFIECAALGRVRFPSTLRVIEKAAFRACESLREVTLPKGLRQLPRACFYECISLVSAHLPEGLLSIGAKAFSGCSSLSEVTIGAGLTEIDEYAFELCTDLCSLILPDELKRIGRCAFTCCHRLSDLSIPAGVTDIGSGAFYETGFLSDSKEDFVIVGEGILIACKSLSESVAVPEGVCRIGELAFAYNERVRSISLPEGVTEICERAFERCTALENISLPESLRVVGSRVFEDCVSLTEIKLPAGVRLVGSGAFGRSGIESDGGLVIGHCLISCKSPADKLPDGITVIAGGAFSGCEGLSAVSLGGAEYVCGEAFRWCRELEEVHIPAGVKYIGEYAFAGCDSLHVHLARARRTMGECAFEEGQQITFEDGERSFKVQLQNDLVPGSPEHALMGFAAEPSESRFMQLYYSAYMIPAAVCYCADIAACGSYLRENIVPAVKMAVWLRDNEWLGRILELRFLSERQAADCAAYAIEQNAIEQQIMIMRHKQDSFGGVTEAQIDDRFDW